MATRATKARGKATPKAIAVKAAAKPRRAKTRLANTGAPTLLTPETTESLTSMLALGNFMTAACDYTGVSQAVVYKWLKRGNDELRRIDAMRSELVDLEVDPTEAPFVEFVERITRAQAAGEVFVVGTLRSAMTATQFIRDADGNLVEKPDWNVRERAAKDFAAIRYRHMNPKVEIEQTITADISSAITVSTAQETRERLEALILDADEHGVFTAAKAALGDGGED